MDKSLSPEERQKDVWTVQLLAALAFYFVVSLAVVFAIFVVILKLRTYSSLEVAKAKLARGYTKVEHKKKTKLVGFFHPNW